MSTIVLKGRPLSNFGVISRKRLSDLEESEKGLIEQQEHLKKINELLAKYAPRCAQVEAHYSTDPKQAEQINRVWKRLTVEPLNPAKLLERTYIPRAAELREESTLLWKALSENMKRRERLIDGWYAHVEDASYRIYLLGELEKQLEAYETQLGTAPQPSHKPNKDLITDLFIQEAKQAMERNTAEWKVPKIPEPCDSPTKNSTGMQKADFTRKKQSERNQRRYQRIRLGTAVSFCSSEHFFFTGFTENISSGGIFIATYDLNPQIGTRFSVNLTLPNKNEMNVICEVSWVREYSSASPEISPGFGCQLINLSDSEQEVIDQYIENSGSMFMPRL